MKCMFKSCENLKSIDLSNFDTSNVTDMEEMFTLCKNLENIDLSNFDTSNVTHMEKMFLFCENLTSIDLSSSLNSKNLKSIDISNLDKQLKDINISTFNTERVKNMYCMFSNCINLKSITFSSSFKTENVTDMKGMIS